MFEVNASTQYRVWLTEMYNYCDYIVHLALILFGGRLNSTLSKLQMSKDKFERNWSQWVS